MRGAHSTWRLMHCREAVETEARATDGAGNMYLTVKELQKQEEQRRAGRVACLRRTGWRHLEDGSESLLCLRMRGPEGGALHA